MPTLTITARGQVTFRKDLLQHMGLEPGQKVEVNKQPDGKIILEAAKPTGTIDDFIGLFAGKTTKVATLEEIEKAAQDGWAGLVDL
jgi:bifunctional DNA-binding transcriptional regulator/antitoxin component of YhaV-PrlF toxin-antitoxin module